VTRVFDTVLIANRGEIAVRVIRTLRSLGVRSIAVYSDADADARHVVEADAAVRIGAEAPSESYLHVDRVLDAALAAGAQAVHPGYGFLSENARFARAVEAAGLVFVGPPADAIELMGDKIRAKEAMAAAGVPVVPGEARPAAAGRACDWSSAPRTWPPRPPPADGRRPARSVTTRCSSSASCPGPGTSRCR
jgi:acetyl-CoA/propionyl-CoA carboxylase biotin carboxyl carrier protein